MVYSIVSAKEWADIIGVKSLVQVQKTNVGVNA
jgi:hypothetical protein